MKVQLPQRLHVLGRSSPGPLGMTTARLESRVAHSRARKQPAGISWYNGAFQAGVSVSVSLFNFE